jgi:hypothetical protein
MKIAFLSIIFIKVTVYKIASELMHATFTQSPALRRVKLVGEAVTSFI